ncbi:MAG: NAD(P)-dependent alcohol dehydrogenase [Rhodospirillaceae bacterium]|nr:NAD(P)-dependent alcohol dehydrogenase [Rhodospirillaceae bacterium]
MLAAICTGYGGPGVVHLGEVETPVPKDKEVLIRIHATTVSSGDCRIRGANFPTGFGLMARLIFGLSRPRQPILGTECSGVIEAIGSGVARFRPGDAVIAFGGARFRCHAQYRTMREDGTLTAKPAGLGFEDAAAIAFGGTTALHFLRGPGRLKQGERLLVNGASGCVGVAALQLAKHFGAHATAVCSGAKSELVRSLGADAVIDYGSADFATSGERWDVIIDTVGNAPFARTRNALNENGRLLLVASGLPDLLKAPFQSMMSGRKVAGGPAPERAEDLALLAKLAESGAVRPVVDSTYPLARIADAHARVETGRKTGSVVVTLEG